MKRHPRPIDDDFPEETFVKQVERFSQLLASRLAAVDEETKWDDYFYSPLEAEVEVFAGGVTKHSIVDLVTALKRDQGTQVVVLLGDPGSGKSVALRKLAREVILEFAGTGKLPVYVNLREWSASSVWSPNSPPTSADLRAFLLSSLKGHSLFADQFLAAYFDKMVTSGRFFFLLDSFDEIPGVLDVSEASWLIKHLSSVLLEFFSQQTNGRGIVASRFYPRPSFPRSKSVLFQIRPFSDLQIHGALLRSNLLKQATIDELFRSRPELVPVARNPFAAALIRAYAETNGATLPANQLSMYESYVVGRLTKAQSELATVSLTAQDVISGAVAIAWVMFATPEIGLEAPVSKIAALLPGVRVQEIALSLRYAGLARMSANADPRFSFVHRRLNEYFVATHFIANPKLISLESIPTDSRYRDALVLFCEVATKDLGSRIAPFC